MNSKKKIILLLLLQAYFVNGFSWRNAGKVKSAAEVVISSATTGSPLQQIAKSGSRLPSSYEITLKELRDLESEPLCHRTAARLLMNNCEVLEGKNEASVLTESGRKIRDFVDSYAASLAICDLERGSFQIPRECNNFREQILNQHIFLFQRLTKIMGKLTDDADEIFEERLNGLELRAKATGDRIDEISPKVDHLKDSLKSIEDFLLTQLKHSVKETTDAVSLGAHNAASLQKMLEVVLKGVLEGQAEVASTYEKSIRLANQRAEAAMDTAIQAVAVVAESAAHLRNQVELSHLQAIELESRQSNLEQVRNIIIATF
ncbi:hypothetical protein Daesc_001936 [Daldinia eschscholtzii]|uniref:Uncharacterized protein n=1 Tax=Daldinia eschscholtzii TaxID=292717 RepID=A0AAX6MW81_9PEZI